MFLPLPHQPSLPESAFRAGILDNFGCEKSLSKDVGFGAANAFGPPF